MLTISQLADYAGVAVRAVRHYHRIGLLPEPPRDHSGYRRYTGQDVVDLVRIRTLAAAGVPLGRIGGLLEADAETFEPTRRELDAELRARIRELQEVRRALRLLDAPEEICLPAEAVRMHRRLRELGFDEAFLRLNRDGWILVDAVYPGSLSESVTQHAAALEDPDYVRLLLDFQSVRDLDPDDAAVEQLARRTVELLQRHYPVERAAEETDQWGEDRAGYQVVASYSAADSPAWRRLDERVIALAVEAGYPSPAG